MINHLPYGSDNIDLKITQQVAPSIFSLRENFSKSLIMPNFKIALQDWSNSKW